MSDPRQFENIVLKNSATANGLILLKDVGHAEVGAENYNTDLKFSGGDAVGIGVQQLSNANALDVDKRCRAVLMELEKTFPPGLKYTIAVDTTTVIGDSVHEVLVTLVEAIVIVVVVIFLFLQDWRATVIPAITIPVSLIGTFAFIKIFGFSINSLTLFGITLATGLVVDDAIVVIENVQRHLSGDVAAPPPSAAAAGVRPGDEAAQHAAPASAHIAPSHQGAVVHEPHQATSIAMAEVTSAVIATSLVLISVFVPVSFFPGTTGILYKQFSLTIAFSIAISAFNALTLSPALAALLLRPEEHKTGLLGALLNPIDRGIKALSRFYARAVTFVVRSAPGHARALCRRLGRHGVYVRARAYGIHSAGGPVVLSLYRPDAARRLACLYRGVRKPRHRGHPAESGSLRHLLHHGLFAFGRLLAECRPDLRTAQAHQ